MSVDLYVLEGRSLDVELGKPAVLAVALSVCGALGGCGSSSDHGTAPTASSTSTVKPASSGTSSERSTVRLPRVPGVTAARGACRGRSAEQVRRRYLGAARAHASKAEATFLRVAAKPPASVRESSSLPYLAARVYAMSVPAKHRAGAYAGCAYELSMKKSVKESGR